MLIWISFIALILGLLALDLGVFHRKSHVVSVREALGWSGVWITLAVAFAWVIYAAYSNGWQGLGQLPDPIDGTALDGPTATIKYLTGYVVEKSLSVDNIFVIAMIFAAFGVPARYQHRVLFWGILGALVMRGAMIAAGSVLLTHFHWVLYVFGAFLIITGFKMLFVREGHKDPARNPIVRWARRFFPVTEHFHGEHFVVRAGTSASCEPEVPGAPTISDGVVAAARAGTWLLTPLALALILVEVTDLIFAVDSIPAIFAITGDPFLVFTSNVFAILGLRSLYFALAGMLDRFRYLKTSLAVVLVLVGVKMLAAKALKEALGSGFNLYVLGVILGILAIGIVASLLATRGAPGEKGKERGAPARA